MTMTATYSPEDNKLRLYSMGRLPRELYERVRAAGFIWAPKQELFVAPMWTPGREDLLLELCGDIDDEDKGLVDRAQERSERFDEYSDKRAADAERAKKAVSAIADNIPLGQPILVGHHSEKRARKDAERIQSGMRKAVRMWETSEYWTRRAEGAIAHAKYKERPDVRHRRIKGLESDLRKQLKEIERADAFTKAWRKVLETLAEHDEAKNLQRAAAIANYDHISILVEGKTYQSAWSLLDKLQRTEALPKTDLGEEITLTLIGERAMRAHERNNAGRARWVAHFENRLAYERAMLQEAGGLITDRFGIVVGGQVLAGRDWLVVLKVNRAAGRINSLKVAGHRWRPKVGIEQITDYRPPADGDVAKVKAATKLPPLCNYPGEGFVEMKKEDFDRRKRAQMAHVRRADATEKHGAHRYRETMKPGGSFKLVRVFITDEKRKDPPPPPSSPAPAMPDTLPPEPRDPVKLARALREKVKGDGVNCPHCETTLIDHACPESGCKHCPNDKCPAAHDFGGGGYHVAPAAATFAAMKESLRHGVKVVSAPQLFPTPRRVVDRMLALAEIESGHRVLEPSAGTGAIADELVRYCGVEVVAIEINRDLCARLIGTLGRGAADVKVQPGDFLEQTSLGTFDRILMNPPFEKGNDIAHILHARSLLKPGGRLVAICANGPRQNERLQPLADSWEELPPDTFAGTSVRAVLLTMSAADDAKSEEAA